MNKKIKNKTNKIIITIVIIMFFNFVMPNFVLGVEINGGIFFKPIAQFIARVADLLIQGLQLINMGDGSIQGFQNLTISGIDIPISQSDFFIRYSPGVIFTGKLPMFDVNFINPESDYEVTTIMMRTEKIDTITKEQLGLNNSDLEEAWKDLDSNYNIVTSFGGIIYEFFRTGSINPVLKNDGVIQKDSNNVVVVDTSKDILSVNFTKTGETEANNMFLKAYANYMNAHPKEYAIEVLKKAGAIFNEDDVVEDNDIMSGRYGNDERGFIDLPVSILNDRSYGLARFMYYTKNWDFALPDKIYRINVLMWKIEEVVDGKTDYGVLIDAYELYYNEVIFEENGEKIQTIGQVLRSFIVTWYNVFKEVALVGLMVILVYVAIRMILSSTSKDKAKYKKMFVDWLVAICILFVLQYMISIILVVTEAISDLFAANVLGQYGEDVLISNLRNEIEWSVPANFMKVFAEIVIYVVLVVYTLLFTIQYLKRTVYLALLTLISPLVALTYPLDKIKDGKAQAFSAWLKEFIYTSLVQPVHLILYVLLVNTAIDFAIEVPIYAIVVIGFLLPAEKFVKKMFGLDQSNAVGKMASAIGGATIMNAIKKLGSAKKASGAKGKGQNNKIRTAKNGVTSSKNESSKNGKGSGSSGSGSAGSRGGANGSTSSKRNIKNQASRKEGFKNLAKKYVLNKNVGMGVLRGAGKVAGAATLGTIGLAAGLATGETENAFAGAIGGIAAGKTVGGNLVDGGANIVKGAAGGINDIKDTYNEGKYGKEEYERMKFDKEFKNSSEYKRLTEKYEGQEGNIQEFLDAGITDTGDMDKAMKSISEGKYNAEEAIAYMNMAKAADCPDDVLNDSERFKLYLGARGIPTEQAEKIRKGIEDFK